MEAVFDWITQYGYIALFMLLMLGIVGLPIPDETLMVFCGYLISVGTLNPVATWLTAFAGSVCGISISYVLGRTFGLKLIHNYGKYLHFTPDRLDRVLKWFDRIGHWTLFVGYYIAGVRHFTAVVAGTSGLKPLHFGLYAYTGGAVWVTTFLTIGYFVGENWKHIAEQVHHSMTRISIVVLALIGIGLLVRWMWMRHRNRKAVD
jgi:membrane protein DedA with SNARE-associated domain